MWSGSIETLDSSVEGTDRDPFSITSTSEPAGVVSTSSQSSPIDDWLASTRWTRDDVKLAADVILAIGILIPVVIQVHQQL